MKDKLRPISNLPFLACLGLLLLNDFYFKSEYPNWVTGKLSDVCGLFVFAFFWTAIFPDRKRVIYFTTALLFVIWKSPYSQVFIDFFSDHLYTIRRTVDFSDLMALLVLPLGFFYVPSRSVKVGLNPVPIAFLTVISFCATSVPKPKQVFTQPQYLLFKSDIVKFENSDYPTNYQVYDLDSLLVIGVKEVQIDKRAAIDDEYHKAKILKDLDLRLLRAAEEPYGTETELNDYIKLRDSLIVDERTSIVLPLDSITEHLNFEGTRLEGRFTRLSKAGKLLIDGRFKNGIEDSVWSFYDSESRLLSRKYFEHGELTKTESFENAELMSARSYSTRQEVVRNKYFHLAILALMIVAIVSKLVSNCKHSRQQDVIRVSTFGKAAATVGLPIIVFILARLISSWVPNSYSPFFLGIFGQAIMIYVVTLLLFLIIFYFLKLKTRVDLVLYVLLFALLTVFTEEWIYLSDISN